MLASVNQRKKQKIMSPSASPPWSPVAEHLSLSHVRCRTSPNVVALAAEPTTLVRSPALRTTHSLQIPPYPMQSPCAAAPARDLQSPAPAAPRFAIVVAFLGHPCPPPSSSPSRVITLVHHLLLGLWLVPIGDPLVEPTRGVEKEPAARVHGR